MPATSSTESPTNASNRADDELGRVLNGERHAPLGWSHGCSTQSSTRYTGEIRRHPTRGTGKPRIAGEFVRPSYSANRTRWRSQPANESSSIMRTATPSITRTASSTSGGSGSQCPPLRSTNSSRHAPRRTLVAIRQRVVSRQATREHRRLVIQVGIEVLVSEAGLRRVQR